MDNGFRNTISKKAMIEPLSPEVEVFSTLSKLT